MLALLLHCVGVWDACIGGTEPPRMILHLLFEMDIHTHGDCQNNKGKSVNPPPSQLEMLIISGLSFTGKFYTLVMEDVVQMVCKFFPRKML